MGLSGPGDNGALLNGAGLLEPLGVDAIEQLIGDVHVVDVFSPSGDRTVIFGQSFAVAFPSGSLVHHMRKYSYNVAHQRIKIILG